MNTELEMVYQRALRGDLEALREIIPFSRRGSLSPEQKFSIFSVLKELEKESKSLQLKLGANIASITLSFGPTFIEDPDSYYALFGPEGPQEDLYGKVIWGTCPSEGGKTVTFLLDMGVYKTLGLRVVANGLHIARYFCQEITLQLGKESKVYIHGPRERSFENI